MPGPNRFVESFPGKPPIPAGADKIVACLATAGGGSFIAQEIVDGVVTFFVMERNGYFAVKYRRQWVRKRFWKKTNMTTEEWVRVGFVPMVWLKWGEATEWITDLKQRAQRELEPWCCVEEM